MVTPPASKQDIKNARKHPAQKNGCDVEAGSFTISWRGNTAHIGMKAETYYAPPESVRQQPANPAITISESVPRIYSDTLAQLDAFREAMAARADEGCMRAGETTRLQQAITETFPFPATIAAYLRFGPWTRTGYVELTPGFVLRLVSTVGKEPEVSVFEMQQAADGHRVQIKLASGTGTGLQAPPAPGYYRYLYRTGASAHNYLATILGAADREVLHGATQDFFTDPDKYCEKPSSGVYCQGVTAGMNAGFYLRVNGKNVFARIGGMLGEVVEENSAGLRVVGRPRTLPHIQEVRRMYRGKLIPIKFDGSSNDIFGLILMPGDEVTF
jgi:hypothetical protein